MPAAIAAGVFDNVENILFQYGYEKRLQLPCQVIQDG